MPEAVDGRALKAGASEADVRTDRLSTGASFEGRRSHAAADDAPEGRLYVVGTPIGNLGDLSPRAVETFRKVDAVCCEDTRVTGRLLGYAGVSRPLIRCDENVIADRAPELVARMQAGERLAFASDAGMPGVSDPGQVLVDAARDAGVAVEVVPGPVACVTALVASGMPCEHFFFEGFLPRKEGERTRRLAQLSRVPGALLFYESPHRAAATLATIARVLPAREAALCRELTKLHEEVLRAPAPELAELVHARGELKGECVIVVAPPRPRSSPPARRSRQPSGTGPCRPIPTSACARTSATRSRMASPPRPSPSASPSSIRAVAARSTRSSWRCRATRGPSGRAQDGGRAQDA